MVEKESKRSATKMGPLEGRGLYASAHLTEGKERKKARPKEVGGVKGPDPTRYGDWEKNGRCIDF